MSGFTTDPHDRRPTMHSASMDEELELVARRLRTWRDEAGLTLQQLAERCGVATSTVQKIETRQMIPTIAVLLKVARGLGKNVGEFVTRDDATYHVHHSTPKTQRVFGDGGAVRVERLVGDLRAPELEVWRVHCAPSESVYRHGVHRHGEVLVICESGRMTVHVDGKLHEIERGDTLHFKAELEHGWENPANEAVRFLVIGSLPPALRAVIEEASPRPTA